MGVTPAAEAEVGKPSPLASGAGAAASGVPSGFRTRGAPSGEPSREGPTSRSSVLVGPTAGLRALALGDPPASHTPHTPAHPPPQPRLTLPPEEDKQVKSSARALGQVLGGGGSRPEGLGCGTPLLAAPLRSAKGCSLIVKTCSALEGPRDRDPHCLQKNVAQGAPDSPKNSKI